jgi:hypothetical protein
LAEAGRLKGKTIGIDATTLEANAALRLIVRRNTGEGYQEFLVRLAQESGSVVDPAAIQRGKEHRVPVADLQRARRTEISDAKDSNLKHIVGGQPPQMSL